MHQMWTFLDKRLHREQIKSKNEGSWCDTELSDTDLFNQMVTSGISKKDWIHLGILKTAI